MDKQGIPPHINNLKKELFSYGIINMISAIHQFSVLGADHNLDSSGLDLCIKCPYEIGDVAGISIDVQVKCTSMELKETKTHLKYSIPVRTYNWLINPKTYTKRILVIFLVPENPEDWLFISTDSIISRKCAYWIDLEGASSTKNKEDIQIEIPKENIFSPTSLLDIIKKSAEKRNF